MLQLITVFREILPDEFPTTTTTASSRLFFLPPHTTTTDIHTLEKLHLSHVRGVPLYASDPHERLVRSFPFQENHWSLELQGTRISDRSGNWNRMPAAASAPTVLQESLHSVSIDSRKKAQMKQFAASLISTFAGGKRMIVKRCIKDG